MQKSVRIFAVINMFDIQVLEVREKFCARLKIVLLMKKYFSLEKNFPSGAELFLYVSLHKSPTPDRDKLSCLCARVLAIFLKKAAWRASADRACDGRRGRYLLGSRLPREVAGLLLTEAAGLEKDERAGLPCTRLPPCALGNLGGFAVGDAGRADGRFTVVRVELGLL